jgi:hypothetical protein
LGGDISVTDGWQPYRPGGNSEKVVGCRKCRYNGRVVGETVHEQAFQLNIDKCLLDIDTIEKGKRQRENCFNRDGQGFEIEYCLLTIDTRANGTLRYDTMLRIASTQGPEGKMNSERRWCEIPFDTTILVYSGTARLERNG